MVAISTAVSATLRSGTGSNPIPTVTQLVVARIAVAMAIPLSLKQSSQIHSCASPAVSAAAATAPSRSGGWSGVKMAASVGVTRARSVRASGW
jgi:hypothetical protein